MIEAEATFVDFAPSTLSTLPFDGAPPVAPDRVPDGPPLAPRGWKRLGVGTWIVLAAATLLALWLVDWAIGTVVYNQHQAHLSSQYRNNPQPWMAPGRAIAVLQIPKLGMNLMVAEGDSVQNLRGGPVHLRGTPDPGAAGNAVVLGHRRRYGGPFAKLDSLVPNDNVFVRRVGTNEVLTYTVESVRRRHADDLSALQPADDTRLTLVTSAPGLFTHDRVVVVAKAQGPAREIENKSIRNNAPPRVPNAFDPSKNPAFNREFFFGAAWLGLGVLLLRRMRSSSAVLAFALAAGPIVLGALLLWFNLDQLLPSTL